MMAIKVDTIKPQITEILLKHGVRRAAFFGSVARGDTVDGSDIDILVDLAADKSLLDLVAIKLEIEDLLGISVHVLTYKSLLPAIRETVLREQLPII
jgi:predicted nucleotidyltransferase